MKQRLLLIALVFVCSLSVKAQSSIRFGYLNVDSLLQTLPDYAEAQKQTEALRQKYMAEAYYNE